MEQIDLNNIELGLSKSKFRSRFHLKDEDKQYVADKGIDVIRQHTIDFVNKKLKIKLLNDGKQTPFKGHPTFIAQHATATCCRECIYKWYKIPTDIELTEEHINFIADRIINFIQKEI
jgi:hypothetical protein